MRSEEVSVVFVTHERTEEGNIRTRRLFHTLNRYARPTTTGENVAIDEDNIVSITTRMLLKSGMGILDPKLIELRRKNLTKTQGDKFTSLAALYDFNLAVLEAVYPFTKNYLRFRPAGTDVENAYNAISSLWSELRARVDAIDKVETERSNPGEAREPGGNPEEGNLLFRPLGLRIYGSIIAAAVEESEVVPIDIGCELDPTVWSETLDLIQPLTLTMGETPWCGTIIRAGRIETGARSLALQLAKYMLDIGGVDEEKLTIAYREHVNDSDAVLPEKVI